MRQLRPGAFSLARRIAVLIVEDRMRSVDETDDLVSFSEGITAARE